MSNAMMDGEPTVRVSALIPALWHQMLKGDGVRLAPLIPILAKALIVTGDASAEAARVEALLVAVLDTNAHTRRQRMGRERAREWVAELRRAEIGGKCK